MTFPCAFFCILNLDLNLNATYEREYAVFVFPQISSFSSNFQVLASMSTSCLNQLFINYFPIFNFLILFVLINWVIPHKKVINSHAN